MENKRLTPRWQDFGCLFIGLWLLLSPWLINYSNNNGVPWSESTYIALAIVVLSLCAIFVPNVWCEGLIFGIGAWMISSPLVANLEVTAPDQRLHQIMMVDSILTSVLLLVLSSWVIFEDGRLQKMLRKE